MTAPKFADRDEAEIAENTTLRSDQEFEVLRRDGEEEMLRPASSLAFSGLAAGLAIGFSVIAEAVIQSRLPDTGWGEMVADMGYTVGFLLIILGKLQLFTENTMTPVMPICHAPTKRNVGRLARIWSIVFVSNMVGTVLFAMCVMKTGFVGDDVAREVLALGRHAAHGDFVDTVVRGVGAGFLIAVLVWMLADSANNRVLVVFLVTYVIALCGFAHVVAGGVEMAALVIAGERSLSSVLFGFMVPALIGNILGGTLLFGTLAYAQIKNELVHR